MFQLAARTKNTKALECLTTGLKQEQYVLEHYRIIINNKNNYVNPGSKNLELHSFFKKYFLWSPHDVLTTEFKKTANNRYSIWNTFTSKKFSPKCQNIQNIGNRKIDDVTSS